MNQDPIDDLNTQLLVQRQQSRIADLQSFLALLIVRHGYRTDVGFRIDMTGHTVDTLRAQLVGNHPEVVITYEQGPDMHVLDAIALT